MAREWRTVEGWAQLVDGGMSVRTGPEDELDAGALLDTEWAGQQVRLVLEVGEPLEGPRPSHADAQRSTALSLLQEGFRLLAGVEPVMKDGLAIFMSHEGETSFRSIDFRALGFMNQRDHQLAVVCADEVVKRLEAHGTQKKPKARKKRRGPIRP